MKVTIKHVDGISDVIANAILSGKEIVCEYRYEKMSYTITMDMNQAIKQGIIKRVRATNSFRKMEKDKVYDIVGVEYLKDDSWHDDGTMIIDIGVGSFHNSNFNPAF